MYLVRDGALYGVASVWKTNADGSHAGWKNQKRVVGSRIVEERVASMKDAAMSGIAEEGFFTASEVQAAFERSQQ